MASDCSLRDFLMLKRNPLFFTPAPPTPTPLPLHLVVPTESQLAYRLALPLASNSGSSAWQ